MDNVYYNVICEEICITGGKIIHVDENANSLPAVLVLLSQHVNNYPNAKWEIYPMYIK